MAASAPMAELVDAAPHADPLPAYLATCVRDGWRVEAHSGTGAVLVHGHRPNHLLHFFITLFTVGAWLLVWVAVSLFGGESRFVAVVGPDGAIHRQSPGMRTAHKVLFGALAVWLFLIMVAAFKR
jgi:hypothetical protein